MFNLPEHFDERLSYVFSKSVNYWIGRKEKRFEIEHLLYTMIKENDENIIKFFDHFSIDYNNDIIKAIDNNSFFKYKSNVPIQEDIEFGNISFTPSFVETSTRAFISVSSSNPLDTIISFDDMFLTMCTSDTCKLNTYLNNLGLSNEVIREFFYGLDDTNISDAIDNLLNKDDDIFGSSSGGSGTDTLDPNPNSKKHKSEKIHSDDRSVINLFAHNMLDDVKDGKIGNIIGRDKEIELLQEILCRKNKRNALLIGEPGVGKTAIAEGLAIAMYNGNVPYELRNKRLYNFDVNSIVSGTRYRGDFEERMKALMDEITKSKDIILFIDEIHMIIGAGGNIGGSDMSNILKPALARGDVQVIGGTTQDEYQKYFMKDGALERRFQIITVNEPNDKDTKLIIEGLRDSFEEYHMVKIDDSAIDAAIRYGKQYIPARYAPDKTIDLIDIAGAKTKLRTKNYPPEILELQEQIEELRNKKNEAARSGNLVLSRKIQEKENALMDKLKTKEEEFIERINSEKVTITEESIAEVISNLTDIPASKVSQSDADLLLNLESIIHKKLIGQDRAVSSISRCIRRNMSGLRDTKKPLGSFLFMGPTGVGKTELARQLAIEVFGKESSLLKFDMSEYSEKFDISKLLGSQPGYVGYEEGGKLTEAVRRNPYSVVLLDEIEKAHKDIYNVFLSILDDGKITDAKGRKIYFNNCIIIMTSNIGAEKAYDYSSIGFDKNDSEKKIDENFERINSIMKKECERHFSPEFLNRLDEIIIFDRLTHDQLRRIVGLMMDKLNERIKHRNINIILTENMIDHIIDKGYNPKYGARPISRAINEIVEDYLSIRLLKNEIIDGMTVEMDYINNDIKHIIK